VGERTSEDCFDDSKKRLFHVEDGGFVSQHHVVV
jgi:hypothetical protein